MQEVKMNHDLSIHVDAEKGSVSSGMIGSVQNIRIEKEVTREVDNKGENE